MAVVVMMRVMSLCSTKPAARVTTSRLNGLPAVVTLNVVAVALMLPLGVTLVPLTLRYSPPYVLVWIVSLIVWLVLVVLVMLPCVKLGVTDCAVAAHGANANSNRRRHFMVFWRWDGVLA